MLAAASGRWATRRRARRVRRAAARLAGGVAAEGQRQVQLLRARGEQRGIGQAHQLARQLALCQRQAQLRTYARRLTRRQRDARDHDLYST